jgi:hypothetical protein
LSKVSGNLVVVVAVVDPAEFILEVRRSLGVA